MRLDGMDTSLKMGVSQYQNILTFHSNQNILFEPGNGNREGKSSMRLTVVIVFGGMPRYQPGPPW